MANRQPPADDDARREPELPADHPLAGKEDLLDTHAGHLEAFADALDEADVDDVHAVMLIVSTDEGTDTIPSVDPSVDALDYAWHMLAAHIAHVADALGALPGEVAQHAVHVLSDQQPGGDPE